MAAACASWYLVAPPFSPLVYGVAITIGVLGCFAALYYADAYGLKALSNGRDALRSVIAVMGMAFILAIAVHQFAHLPSGAVKAMGDTAALYFPLLLIERVGFRIISSLTPFTERLLIVGASDLGVASARYAINCRRLGTNLVGFLSDELVHERSFIEGVPVLGKVHQLEKIVDDFDIDRIVVASKGREEHFPAEELLNQKLRGVTVESGISFYERISGRVYIRDLRPSYLIFSEGFRTSRLAASAKRAIDIGVSATGLLFASPLLLLCAIAIRLDSPGSVFFAQERVGKGGKLFFIWKLRSMRTDAEAESGPVWTQTDDLRVTRVGKTLRMTRMDEVPQLWNVLKGEMSLVGPRPERPEFVESLSVRYPYFALRDALKPGVTGWAQIQKGYVNEVEEFEEKLALDIYYMKYRSTLMDLLILWKTAKTVLLMGGV
ncbi:MAG: sugar transferase [Myxococcales bacterium]|nr:sugar transferase [Myxococcales bacterium]